MAGYLMVLPVLLWFTAVAVGKRKYVFFEKVINRLNFVLTGIAVLVFGANVFIYEEWQTLLNNRALKYMSTPSALLDSMSTIFVIMATLLFLGGVFLFTKIYQFWVGKHLFQEKITRKQLFAFPVLIPLLVLFIRGWGIMPINESAVYYTTHPFYNHAATNPGWYLAHSFLETRSAKNNYAILSPETVRESTQRLLPRDTAAYFPMQELLNTSPDTPTNVVFIIMESMTAQVIEELGGEKGVCPNFSRFIKDGLLFTHCYGSGYRTDQGIISILAGYPAQPDQSIILLTDKAAKLNSIPRQLKEQSGYSTAFVYGGELTFANMGVWLANQRFDRIVSQKDFPGAEQTQRWGVDDKRMLQRTVEEINGLQEPFFAAGLTLSLHPPFDVPFQSQWNGKSERELFLNSAAFADHALGAFFESAARQPWFNRTLFVVVADHGSYNPVPVGMDHPRSRQVPLLFISPRLKSTWRGKKIDTWCNYHDLPATLLQSPNLQEQFPWSRNLLHTTTSFAYYTNEEGVGWSTPQGTGFYRYKPQQWQFFGDSLSQQSKQDAQAYLQGVYEDFLKR